MAIDVDGFGILRSIGENPQIFTAIEQEINKTARMFVTKQIKDKTTNLVSLRAMHGVLGDETFAFILDDFSDSATIALAKRLDKNHPEIASASPQWSRKRIEELVKGAAEPVPKMPKKVTATSKGEPKEKPIRPNRLLKPKVERALNSKALAARWDGKNHKT